MPSLSVTCLRNIRKNNTHESVDSVSATANAIGNMCPFPSTDIAIISFPLYLPYRNVASI
ncbi:hypothetical protein Syun_001470 [Stephania yunnanensis]|uniref:Uncharacterized protein n=1 Tax=Stephania yunnanensis TaxID=152371 RepID=A0AAP0Q6H8_9MAGN